MTDIDSYWVECGLADRPRTSTQRADCTSERCGRSLRSLQEILGDHQDAAVAEAWLRGHVPELSPRAALVAGELVAVQRAEAERLRAAWPAAWHECSRPRAVEWLG